MADYRKLQNGSDIRGVALEGVSGQEVNLTPQVTANIGAAFAVYLKRRLGRAELRLAVGRDSRLSGESLAAALCQGAQGQGAAVTDFGLCSTPAMFMCTVTEGLDFDGAMMLTASHLPFNRNGVKFFTPKGGLEKADITEILELAAASPAPIGQTGPLHQMDFLSLYASLLADKVRSAVQAADYDHPLRGFHIVVDAGNGAGGFYARKVLEPLGADVSGSQYLEPDGHFPAHAPNPEDKAAMDSIAQCVLENKADLGVIFDTDVDRAGAVGADGTELNRNRLIALISAILLEEHPGTTIVTDSITSTGLAEFIRARGGVHLRYKRGYRNVINESVRLNAQGIDSQLAIETSGHAALKENYFLDDGAYLVTKLIIKMAQLKGEGRTLMSLIDDLREPAESAEVRMNLLCEDFSPYGQQVLEGIQQAAAREQWTPAKDNHEGVRVEFGPGQGDGWFLIRMSLHDPLMPVNIESDVPGGVRAIAQKLYKALQPFDRLDLSGLEKLL